MLPEFLTVFDDPAALVPVAGAALAYLAYRLDLLPSSRAVQAETIIRKWARSQLDIPTPATAEITPERLSTALTEAGVDTSDVAVAYSDGRYFSPDPSDIDDVRLGGSVTSILPYRPERFDCENYAGLYRALVAFGLGVNAVGVVYDWSGDHAYNVVVDSDGQARFYEPQADEWVSIGSGDYPLTDALIVF